ncbi:T9SS type A sorting domain-containing protein [bacterium]|nr:T9SS type A sorting domain-containing protein [bacterium]
MRKRLLPLFFGLALAPFSAVHAQYCAAGPSSTFDSEIEDVILLGDNFGISNLGTCPGQSGVANFTATDSADVSLGSAYNLSVKFTSCSGFYYNGVGQAWIDWNQNNTFEAGESVGQATFPNTAQPFVANMSFVVPANAVLGETRLRIMDWEGGVLPLNPCGTYTWGAVEDYKIVVTNTPPPCPNPPFPVVINLTSTSATFYIGGSGTAFNFEWGPGGFTQGTGTTFSATNDTVSLTGLTPNTTYSIYAQNNCGTLGTSLFAGPTTFTTLCAPYNAPFVEGFDALPTNQPANCWEVFSNGGATQLVTSNSFSVSPASAPNHLEFYNQFANHAFLVGPELSGLASNLYQVTFKLAGQFGTYDITLGSTNSLGDTTTFFPLGTFVAANGQYNTYTVYLANIPTGHTRLAFKHDDQFTFSTVYIDDFDYQLAPACIPPVGVTINPGAFSADISYVFNGGSQVSFEWGPVGFTQGTGTTGTSGMSPISLTGLSANTTYSIYLQGNCGANGISPWVGPFTFTTNCAPFTAPYFENFDAATVFQPINCWDVVSNGTGFNVATQQVDNASFSVTPVSTPNHLNFYNSFSSQAYLLSPELQGLSNNLYQVSFSIAGQFSSATIEVGTVDASGDTAGFHSLGNIQVLNNAYTAHTFYVVGIPANHSRFAFKHDASNLFTTVYIDNFAYDLAPSCIPPVGINIAPSATSAQVAYNFVGGTTVSFEWGPIGFTQGTGTTGSSTSSPMMIGGLTSNTGYDVYLQGNCGANGLSPWVGPFTFYTTCLPFTAPYTDNFDGGTWVSGTLFSAEDSQIDQCWSANPEPDPNSFDYGWRVRQGQTGSGATGPNGDHTTGSANYLYAEASGGASGNVAMLTSPQIDITALTAAPQLSFWYHFYGSQIGTMNVQISNDFGLTWTNLINITGQQQTSSAAPWLEQTLDLTAYQNDSILMFRFVATSLGCCAGDLAIDDFKVDNLPACPNPFSLATYNVLSTQAGLTWTSSGSAFNVEYGSQGFGQGSGTSISSTNDSLVLTGLMPNTCYSYYVQNNCGAQGTSAWVGPFNFCTPCVTAAIPYLRDFNTWPPSCWDLTGGTQTPTQNSSALYFNFWSWTSGNWGRARTEPILISQDAFVSFKWSHQYQTFYPNDQLLLMVRNVATNVTDTLVNLIGTTFNSPGSSTTTLGSYITESVTLNPATYTGQTVVFELRGNSGFGPSVFVDDFKVDFVPACPDPTQVSVSGVTSNSANMAWTNGTAGATAWVIEYGPVGFQPGTGTQVGSSTNPAALTGLMPSTAYSAFVYEICANGIDTSNAAGPVSFTTLCAPYTTPYLQDFTGTAPGVIGTQPTPVTLPNCWQLGASSGGVRWETEDATGANENSSATGPFYDNTSPSSPGGMYLYLETSFGLPGERAFVTSPEFNLAGLTAPELTFYYHMYGATIDSLRVDVFNNGVWDLNVWSLFGQQQTAGSAPWTQASVSLANYTGNVVIRFMGRRGTSFTGDISLDDIRVDNAPACPAPSMLTASNITTNSANLGWTVGTAGAPGWIVEYGAPGFALGSGTTVSSTTNSLALTGLNASSNYCYYVYEICVGGQDTSLATGPFCFATACGSATIPYTRDFNTWPPNCWNMTGGTYGWSHYGGQYAESQFWNQTSGNYSIMTSEPILISQAAELGFDWSHQYNATYPNDQLLVMVRTLGAANWDTLYNLIGSTFNTPGAGPTTPGSFASEDTLLPAVYVGQTIEVQFRGNSNFGPNVFVDNFRIDTTSGGPAICLPATALNATSQVCSTAVATWTSTAGASSSIQYGPAGFTPGTGTIMANVNSPYNLSGLSPNTAYDFWILDSCSNGAVSSWAGPHTFTTAAGPLPHIVVSATQSFTGPTSAEVTLSTAGSTGATSYLWDLGNGNSSTQPNPVATYQQNGQYTITVQLTNGCGSSDTTFTITVAGISLGELAVGRSLSLFPNPTSGDLQVSFEDPTGATYELQLLDATGRVVEYRDLGFRQGLVREQFDLESLSKGMYLLRLSSDGKHATRRVVRE